MSLPSISNYGNYSSSNYGAHTRMVVLENITLWYSYNTIIAYRDNQDGRVVSENAWSVTTGKHLNWIDGGDKKSRKPRAELLHALKIAAEALEEWHDESTLPHILGIIKESEEK